MKTVTIELLPPSRIKLEDLYVDINQALVPGVLNSLVFRLNVEYDKLDRYVDDIYGIEDVTSKVMRILGMKEDDRSLNNLTDLMYGITCYIRRHCKKSMIMTANQISFNYFINLYFRMFKEQLAYISNSGLGHMGGNSDIEVLAPPEISEEQFINLKLSAKKPNVKFNFS